MSYTPSITVRDLLVQISNTRAEVMQLAKALYRETWTDPDHVDKFKKVGEILDDLEEELSVRAEGPPSLYIRKNPEVTSAPPALSAHRLGTFHWDTVGLNTVGLNGARIWHVSEFKRGTRKRPSHMLASQVEAATLYAIDGGAPHTFDHPFASMSWNDGGASHTFDHPFASMSWNPSLR